MLASMLKIILEEFTTKATDLVYQKLIDFLKDGYLSALSYLPSNHIDASRHPICGHPTKSKSHVFILQHFLA